MMASDTRLSVMIDQVPARNKPLPWGDGTKDLLDVRGTYVDDHDDHQGRFLITHKGIDISSKAHSEQIRK